jgi:hypothetical protein
MINAINAPSHCFHDKLFTLSWTSDARWVLIYYRNGQSKPWYKRPGRGYRFKRWFVKKGNDQFQNLANFQSPQVVMFFFSSFLSWPKKVVKQWTVTHLDVAPSAYQLHEHVPAYKPVVAQTSHQNIQLSSTALNMRHQELLWTTPQPLLKEVTWQPTHECSWNVQDWMDGNAAMPEDEALQKLIKLTHT